MCVCVCVCGMFQSKISFFAEYLDDIVFRGASVNLCMLESSNDNHISVQTQQGGVHDNRREYSVHTEL